MDSLVVTPASEADLQLLTALLKKMKIKARVVAAPAEAPLSAATKAAKAAANKLIPRTKAERDLVEAIGEMKEIMAGRKQAISLKQFLDEVE
ncbi:hypothetical protein ACFQ48_00530 [Hymenobacter caeli]|uniref:MinD superfamily P-loop ATPase n=1 Tax=Hymenobacter caeli TaxID=2735894 RepID=A0ABX2FL97_9BACT|nr:hypothetical protein [Hymenobacter caeli]NRT17304.1 MinD superfamily P-loop ATPase [Hymenobacter caeli]